ncbi:MAG: protein translocase subunit SecDF [Paludibacteraceae bacterium]|nr:protein translocase subunit SecDF [Paludibacteraceae bacterium]MBQ2051213.1 protein translocase subunit SecDF [Paludibacteraceae bacterium]
MLNKGFVTVIAFCLFIACAFYLSFSVVTSHFTNKAEEISQGDALKYHNYLDSLSNEKVWLGYTLKECREKELNLGLDLKGGMNVLLEVSVPDIVKSLGDENSQNFMKALDLAKKRQSESQDDFLTLFEQAFKEVDPNARLSTVFGYGLKDNGVTINSTNDEVMKVLRAQVDAAVANSFQVLRTRIDRFGVVQPNIQRLENSGRILVELPGIKEPERVRKLLQGSANLEFWETYEVAEIISPLIKANDVLKQMNASTMVADSAAADTAAAPAVAKADNNGKDSLLNALKQEAAKDNESAKPAQASAAQKAQAEKENPLFSIFQVNVSNNGQPNPGCVVGMAHYSDTAKINRYFETKQVKQLLPSDLRFKWGVKAIDEKGQIFQLYAIKCKSRDGKAPLEGDAISDASSDFGQYSSYAKVDMQMNSEGAKQWARLTEENKGRCIAIVLDGYVYSAPRVNDKISGGRSEITGDFTVEEAKDLANVLKSGKMPAPAVIVQEDVVGPSLGQEAIENGLVSAVLAFVLVLIYMVFFYGVVPGLVADGALIVNMFLLFGVLASFKAVLTLPGITGIVLTLGMAIDTNVLIYDRIREELRNGKQLYSAIEEGYSKATSAIIDGNLTTIITGIVLFLFGTGPIKGFATTLIIGILTSLLTGFVLSRVVYSFLTKRNKISQDVKFCTNITKSWFQNTKFKFMESKKYAYVISGIILLVGVVSLCVRGLNQGIDFSGGRNYVVKFDKAVSTEEVKSALAASFDGDAPSVITIKSSEVDNSDSRVRISTNFKIEDQSQEIDGEIEGRLYNGLKSYLKPGTTQEQFANEYILSSQKVGPTVADDIKASAVVAITLSLLAIALYILLRFRNIAFSAGGVLALVHDSLVILGCYSLLYSVMPFSMEIDQAFIAAILTIIGYSINDTVVIFDRVREYRSLYPNRETASVFNDALNSTLGRTFNTSFTTLIVLIAIFIFGGESIRGFVFALLIGIFAGTYSSLFIASPIACSILKKKDKKNLKK